MKKPDGQIDWTIAENDEAWQASQTNAQPEPAPYALRKKQVALAILTAIFLLLVIGGWLWPRHQPSPHTTRQGPKSLLPLEQTLTQTLELLDSSQVNSLQRQGDRVIAQVTVKVHEEGKMRDYRETHFFAKTRDAWQRIAPDATLMGAEKSLKIAHFEIFYRTIDADAVYEAAPKLEQFFATLSHDTGLPLLDVATVYTIEVATDGAQITPRFNIAQRRVTVSSPSLLSAPVEMSAATLLYQATLDPLTRLVLVERAMLHDQGSGARFIYSPYAGALARWEVWEDGGPLASGREPVVRWLYRNSKAELSHQLLPDDYARLCRTYHIWQVAPLDLSIPLTCTDEDKHTSSSLKSLAPLTMLRQATNQAEARDRQESAFSLPITAETVIEYIVARYGRDKLPRLVAALGEYDTLDTLIPALFGVSLADFERGWQSYLAQQYN